MAGKQADGEIEFFRPDAQDLSLVEIGAHPVLGEGRDFRRHRFANPKAPCEISGHCREPVS